jgi:class 3 adenylate cyclase
MMRAMPHLRRKGFAAPDETRTFPNGTMDVITLGEVAFARFVLQPGWRWSKDVAAIARTRLCQHRHLGYTIAGSLRVRMEDGTEMTIHPGDGYEIPPGHDAWVDGDRAWESVEFTSGRTFARSPEDMGERLLGTILFSDIVESTAILERIGDRAWTALIHEHNDRVRRAIDQFRGREIGTFGDGFLAVFDGPAKAVRAGALMDAAVADLGLRIRVGAHTGEFEVAGGEARGVAVHTAARIAALAHAGEVLVSGVTFDLLDGSDLSFAPRGEHELKGLSGPRRVYALRR